MDKSELEKAYKIVLDDMMNSDFTTLQGFITPYMNEYYAYGVNAVMEFIAYKINETTGDNFSEMFWKNYKEKKKVLDKF